MPGATPQRYVGNWDLTLRYWVAGAGRPKNTGRTVFPERGNPKLTDEQREIAELKKKLRDVEIERDILKKHCPYTSWPLAKKVCNTFSQRSVLS